MTIEKTEEYRGFIIAWQEPPLMSNKWTTNVGSNDPRLFSLIRGSGIVDGRTRDDMIAKAKQCIDDLLD